MKYVHIDTIDFSVCESLKKDKLFYDPLEQKYYKIWKESAQLWGRDIGSTFLLALNCGFYENLAEIEAIIISDSGLCVGYVTKSFDCPIKEIDGKLYGDILRYKNKHDFSVFKSASEQDEKYQKFYNILLRNVRKSNFFFYDLVQSNIIDFGDKYGIIDLESVVHIRDINRIPKYHMNCIPSDYFKFLQDQYNEKISFRNSGIDMALVRQAWTMSTGGMDRKPYYEVTINGEYFFGERAWALRWSQFKKELNWKDLKILDMGTCMGMVPVYLLKYCGLESATAIDFSSYLLEASDLVRKAFQIPKNKIRFINIDLDKSFGYENTLGYDYDVIFCLSFLRWIKDQERFLKYLSNFQHIIIEPHDKDGDITETLRERDFTEYKILGESRIGRSFPESEKRTIYHFWKDSSLDK